MTGLLAAAALLAAETPSSSSTQSAPSSGAPLEGKNQQFQLLVGVP